MKKMVCVLLCAASMAYAGVPTWNLTKLQEDLVAEQPANSIPMFKASADTLWGEWQSFTPAGDSGAVFTFAAMAKKSGTQTITGVRVRYDANSAKAQIWVPEWGKGVLNNDGVNFIFDWDTITNACRVPVQKAGYAHATYGEVYVMDMTFLTGDAQAYTQYPCSYNPKKGVFNLYIGYTPYSYIGTGTSFGSGNETLAMNGYVDYDCTIQVTAMIEFGNNKATFGLSATSKNCTKFRYGCVAYSQLPNTTDALENYAKSLTGDFVDLNTNVVTVSTDTTEGMYFVVVATYTNEEVYNSYSREYYYFSPNSHWTVRDSVTYTDDLVTTVSQIPNTTYKVEIQESKSTAGLFRLKNPYGETFPYSTSAKFVMNDTYLYFDASNPSAVSAYSPISSQFPQPLGIDLGKGILSIEQLATGTYADNKITFPTNGFAIYIGNNAYYANKNGKFCIAFPENPSTRVDEVAAEGVKVTKTLRNGQMVIERNGTQYDVMGRTLNN